MSQNRENGVDNAENIRDKNLKKMYNDKQPIPQKTVKSKFGE